MKLMFCVSDKYESPLQVHSIIVDRFDQACPKYLGKFAVSLWHFKKEDNYYTSNILTPLTLFLSQYGIHTKPFLHI